MRKEFLYCDVCGKEMKEENKSGCTVPSGAPYLALRRLLQLVMGNYKADGNEVCEKCEMWAMSLIKNFCIEVSKEEAE